MPFRSDTAALSAPILNTRTEIDERPENTGVRKSHSRVRFGWPDAYSARFHSHDRAGVQFPFVLGQDFRSDDTLAFSTEADETDDAAMRQSMNDGQLAKVLVDCDDDPRCVESAAEDFLVARILRPVGDGFDVKAGTREDSGGTSPDARVEEDLHSD